MRSILFATALGLLVLPVEAQEMETHIWRGEGEDMPMPGLCITRDQVASLAKLFGYESLPTSNNPAKMIVFPEVGNTSVVIIFDGLCATSAEIKG